jgi:Tfp pilus assembly protein PilN
MIGNTDDLFAEQSEAGSFHDVVADVTGESSIPVEQLKMIFSRLPRHVQMTALQWGLSDTVFRDQAFVYLREHREAL